MHYLFSFSFSVSDCWVFENIYDSETRFFSFQNHNADESYLAVAKVKIIGVISVWVRSVWGKSFED